jgi:OmpA-OmpF porin, OOP family
MHLRWLLVVALVSVAAAGPGSGHVVVSDTTVEILDRVTFEPHTATLTASSHRILDAIARTLDGNPGILRVEVQSHTDERGDAKRNLELSRGRAETVRRYIIARGIDPSRLTARGYGGTQPIDRGHNDAAWAKNQRVAFLILKRKD